ncbi:MAG TPA: SgcJ/EcaC family oxidoreductase [Thermoanaerobaculia bacterium]
MALFSGLTKLWIAAALVRGGMVGVPAIDPAIAQVAETYRTAVLAGDAAGAASVFLDDGVEMPPGHPPVRGRAAIERYYRECFAGPCRFTGFVLSPWDVTVAGKVAYNVGASRQTITAGGSTIECSSKYLVVLRRDGGGAWKVAYAIYNIDAPPPAPPAR